VTSNALPPQPQQIKTPSATSFVFMALP
jgi:hypothetical protein